jgi:peroxiredoxin Q/BCP
MPSLVRLAVASRRVAFKGVARLVVSGAAMFETGQSATDFTLPDGGGTAHTLSDYRGGWVLVSFYPADDTPGCTKQACSVRDNEAALGAAGITVLSISPDDQASHQRFTEKYALTHTLLCDPGKVVMEAWGAWGEKMLYGKTVIGTKRIAYLIDPEGAVRKLWKRVRTAEHAEDILKAHAALVA